jgi:putative transposase
MSKTKKRHSVAEIAAKLDEAARLSSAGRNQSEIARTLGVSVMTFHRWRKLSVPGAAAQTGNASAPTLLSAVAHPIETDRRDRVAELQLENSRLRRLVTDLLLEKMSLEDDGQRGRGRAAG